MHYGASTKWLCLFVASRQRKSHVLMQVRCTSHSFTWDFLSLQQPISIKFSCSGTTFPRWFQILSYLNSKLPGSSTPVKNLRRIWPCAVMRNLILMTWSDCAAACVVIVVLSYHALSHGCYVLTSTGQRGWEILDTASQKVIMRNTMHDDTRFMFRLHTERAFQLLV